MILLRRCALSIDRGICCPLTLVSADIEQLFAYGMFRRVTVLVKGLEQREVGQASKFEEISQVLFVEVRESLGRNCVRLSATPAVDRSLELTLLDPVSNFFFANVQDSCQSID